MKKYSILVIALVLTLSMLTGCGCTDRRNEMATIPPAKATTPATSAPTQAPTEAATLPMPSEETGANNDSTESTAHAEDATGGIMDSTSPSGSANTRGRRIR